MCCDPASLDLLLETEKFVEPLVLLDDLTIPLPLCQSRLQLRLESVILLGGIYDSTYSVGE